MKVSHIDVNNNGQFCCATEIGSVYIFEPTSPCPVDTIPVGERCFGILFLPDDSLAFLDRKFILTTITADKPSLSADGQDEETESNSKSLFSTLYVPTRATRNQKPLHPQKIGAALNVDISSILQAPSHAAIPPSKLSTTFLECMLEKVKIDQSLTQDQTAEVLIR